MLSKLYKLSRRRGLQMEAFGSILIAVSYTHLDVYKRQRSYRPPRR